MHKHHSGRRSLVNRSSVAVKSKRYDEQIEITRRPGLKTFIDEFLRALGAYLGAQASLPAFLLCRDIATEQASMPALP